MLYPRSIIGRNLWLIVFNMGNNSPFRNRLDEFVDKKRAINIYPPFAKMVHLSTVDKHVQNLKLTYYFLTDITTTNVI